MENKRDGERTQLRACVCVMYRQAVHDTQAVHDAYACVDRLYIIYEMEHKLVKLCEMTAKRGVLVRALEVEREREREREREGREQGL